MIKPKLCIIIKHRKWNATLDDVRRCVLGALAVAFIKTNVLLAICGCIPLKFIEMNMIRTVYRSARKPIKNSFMMMIALAHKLHWSHFTRSFRISRSFAFHLWMYIVSEDARNGINGQNETHTLCMSWYHEYMHVTNAKTSFHPIMQRVCCGSSRTRCELIRSHVFIIVRVTIIFRNAT